MAVLFLRRRLIASRPGVLLVTFAFFFTFLSSFSIAGVLILDIYATPFAAFVFFTEDFISVVFSLGSATV